MPTPKLRSTHLEHNTALAQRLSRGCETQCIRCVRIAVHQDLGGRVRTLPGDVEMRDRVRLAFLVLDIGEIGEILGADICDALQEFEDSVRMPVYTGGPVAGMSANTVSAAGALDDPRTVVKPVSNTPEASHDPQTLQCMWKDACWADRFVVAIPLLPDEKVERHCKSLQVGQTTQAQNS